MKTAAIICEYNPFHFGHRYHMEETRRIIGEDAAVISVMSGNFVQRGEPAFADKWTRAENAVRMGSDLVIELPFCYACNGAHQFAEGAVKLIESLGCVDYLSFGSESGDIDELIRCIEEDEKAGERIKSGMTYARAMGEKEILQSPNNMLAVEYLRALRSFESGISPVTVKRGDYSSSSDIRTAFREGKDIGGMVPVRCDGFNGVMPYSLIAAAILSHTAEEIDSLPSAGEGIGFKIKSEVRYHSSTEELVDAVRQSRYTKARIKRILCQLLIGPEQSDAVRVLAVGRNGRQLIRRMKKSGVNVITNINKEPGVSECDIRAADYYNLITGRNLYENSDFVRKPYIAIEKATE